VEFNGRNRNVQEIDVKDPLNCSNNNWTSVYKVPYRNISADSTLVSISSD